jgi:hypothetical protein
MAPNIDNEINSIILKLPITLETRGSVGWACVAYLLFCFEET